MEGKLKKLRIVKSPGPDGLHPRVFQEAASVLSIPLSTLYKRSLADGTLPSEWKVDQISPIFKKGERHSPGNYRPVCLTAIVCKVMEYYITTSGYHHGFLSDNQHGFVPGRSCATQLLETLETWAATIDEGYSTDCICLDFAKAFNKVPHERLLQKLSSYGISGNMHSWVRSFLTGRKQRVACNEAYSKWLEVLSGIP